MANSRMWLVYKPTGDAVFLGKRMALGWYLGSWYPPRNEGLEEKLAGLFAKALRAWEQDPQNLGMDDFCLCVEDWDGLGHPMPHVVTDWHYDTQADGTHKIRMGPCPDLKEGEKDG